MNKYLLFLLFAVGCTLPLQAQTGTPKIQYTYDNNGNRVLRRMVVTFPAPAFRGNPSQPLAKDSLGAQTIAIYPNPTKGIFSIGVSGLESEKENYYLLFDIQGKLLKRAVITADRTSVDITWDASGIYLLDVSLGGKVSRWKIVKQ